jgi:hypothetical protein
MYNKYVITKETPLTVPTREVLLSHCFKLLERVIEARLRGLVHISDRQYGAQKGKSTTHAMFYLRILQEKMRKHQKDIHMVFIDPEKSLIQCQESESCTV